MIEERLISIIGEIATIAEPPQIAVPTAIKLVNLMGTPRTLSNPSAARKAEDSVNTTTYRELIPVLHTWFKFNPAPKTMIAHCRIFLDVKVIPFKVFFGLPNVY